ncbi:MAG: RidA family protein [Burkholderiaceae bacterium]|nr:RidA family protein [Burkholderiaceae bacterium]MCD8516282.1 RidA family protein [Burkholderiaceae bacterium]MCD8566314.1 RidA family protein [Burkholderiaceae bacterium]
MAIDPNHSTIRHVESLPARQPGGNYIPFRQVGNLLYVSGQTSTQAGREPVVGQVGKDITIEQGYEGAQICMQNILSVLRTAVGGDWSKVVSCVRLTGYVNSEAPFGDGPKVINGASDLIVQIMGESGRHARSAVGVAALPGNAAVEVEAIFEVR